MIKAIFFDIDGTLVSFDTHRVPDSAVESIAALRRRGIRIFLATGRLITQTAVVSHIPFDGYVTLNGCCCLAADARTVICRSLIPQSDLEAIVEYLEQNNQPFPCSFMDARENTINIVNDRVEQVWRTVDMPVPRIEDPRATIRREIYQANIYVDAADEAPVIERCFPNCEASRWHPMFADVNRRGVSKQSGIDSILEYYGIPLEETMAFGDGGNDVSMLAHVPYGIAMGNAVDSAKAAAAYITDAVDNDGIRNALKHFELL